MIFHKIVLLDLNVDDSEYFNELRVVMVYFWKFTVVNCSFNKLANSYFVHISADCWSKLLSELIISIARL